MTAKIRERYKGIFFIFLVILFTFAVFSFVLFQTHTHNPGFSIHIMKSGLFFSCYLRSKSAVIRLNYFIYPSNFVDVRIIEIVFISLKPYDHI